MQTINIYQACQFSGSPERVYRILTDSELHTELTGGQAQISPDGFGQFSVWDGYIYWSKPDSATW
jgi:hypothetical protein